MVFHMGIKHEAGEGQHVLVRIEHASWPGDAVRRVEFEDSDIEETDSIAGIGWGIRWALDSMHAGNSDNVAGSLLEALGYLDGWLDPDDWHDKTELEYVEKICKLADNLSDYLRDRKQATKKKT